MLHTWPAGATYLRQCVIGPTLRSTRHLGPAISRLVACFPLNNSASRFTHNQTHNRPSQFVIGIVITRIRQTVHVTLKTVGICGVHDQCRLKIISQRLIQKLNNHIKNFTFFPLSNTNIANFNCSALKLKNRILRHHFRTYFENLLRPPMHDRCAPRPTARYGYAMDMSSVSISRTT